MSIKKNQKHHQIVKAQQRLNCLERNLALEKIKKRKVDTRRKIELGGLAIKTGMDQYPKDVILGVLVSGCQELSASGYNAEKQYAELGDLSFRGK